MEEEEGKPWRKDELFVMNSDAQRSVDGSAAHHDYPRTRRA
jgi:hypothetical protein